MHTRWIETEFAETVAALSAAPEPTQDEDDEPAALERVVVEVGGKRLEVVLPAALALGRGPAAPVAARPARPRAGPCAAWRAPRATATARR